MPAKLIKERNSPRGLVPSATYGKFDEPYNEYLQTIAPRENPAAHYALAASTDQRFREFGSRMNEPRYRRYSYAALAKSCDISLPEWADFWRKAQHMRALAIAQDGVVDLATDLTRDVRTKQVTCERCDGFGWVRAEDLPEHMHKPAKMRRMDGPDSSMIRACPSCKGVGTVEKAGDEASRKMLLDMTGMTSKKSAVVQINQNFGGSGIESAVERMNRVSFALDDDQTVDAAADPIEG